MIKQIMMEPMLWWMVGLLVVWMWMNRRFKRNYTSMWSFSSQLERTVKARKHG